MDLTNSDWAQIAWAQAWQVTAVALAVALLVRLAARNRPHLAHVLWLVVLAKCLTPPVWSSPTSMFSWLQAFSARQEVAASDRQQPQPAELQEIAASPADVSIVISRSEGTKPTAAEMAALHDASARGKSARGTTAQAAWALEDPRAARAAGNWPWLAVAMLLVAWLAGALLLAALTALRWLCCWRSIRRAGWRCDAALQARVDELARQLGLRRRVKLIVSGSRVGPAVIGLFKPVILLPAAVVNEQSKAELDPILAHELIHIRRGDLWVGLLQVAMRCLWWFHPLVWMTSRLLTREAERCCDEEVIAELSCPPGRYARSLLAVLELKLKPVPVFPGVRPVEVTTKRLERIMSLRQGCRKRTPWHYRLAMLALAAIVLPGAALVATAEQGADERRQPADPIAPEGGLASQPKEIVPAADEFRIETRIFTASPELIGRLTGDWALFNPNIPADEQPGAEPLAQNRPLAATGGEPRNRAQFTVEKNLPVMYHLIDEKAMGGLVRRMDGDKRANVLSCPKCTLFNGQTATIADSTQRPFVVGVEKVGKDDYQPKIRVVSEGLILRLQPTLRDKRIVRLAYELTLSSIRGVEETEIQRGSDKPITIQVPEIVKYRLEGTTDVPLGKHLVIAGLSNNRPNERPQSMMVAISAHHLLGDGWQEMGAGVNSEAGVTGQITIDEKNFEMIATLVEAFNNLIDERRFAEAEIVAQQAAKVAPKNPVVETMLWKARFARRFGEQQSRNAEAKTEHKDLPGAKVGAGLSALEPPSDDEVLKAFEKKKPIEKKGFGFATRIERDNVRIVKETIADRIDPPRHYPLVGAAKLHHAIYKCTVYFTEVRKIGWPKPHTEREDVSEVIYLDQVRLEKVDGVDFLPDRQAADKPLQRKEPVAAAELQIERQLDRKVSLNFNDAPLAKVMEFLATSADINIYLDGNGLAAEGVKADQPVTINLAAPIRVRSALKLILEPLHLGYKIENEVLQVTSEQTLAGEVYPMVYAVADLVVPLPGGKAKRPLQWRYRAGQLHHSDRSNYQHGGNRFLGPGRRKWLAGGL